MGQLSRAIAVAALLASPNSAAGQQAGTAAAPDETAPEAPESEAPPDLPAEARPALPTPILEEDESTAPGEPQHQEDPEAPVILHRIRLGDHPERDEEHALPRDIAFETPGDLRVPMNQRSSVPRVQPDGADPAQPPRTFAVAAAAGYARFLATEPIDYARIEERFEARVPEIEALRIGVGASQMIGGEGALFGGGVRLGFGAFFCEARWIQCEGVASLQPGVMAGELFGVKFDFNASLNLHFVIERSLELSLSGGYSMLDTNSLLHITGQVGAVF